jgi:hypothetical protein
MTTNNKPPAEPTGFRLSRRWLEPTGMALMALGLLMMFQPFLMVLFTYSFIVILIGTLTFIVAVHLPN